MTTYSILKADIAKWLMRDGLAGSGGDSDFEEATDTFIRNAEARINRDVRVMEQETTFVTNIVGHSKALPEGVLEITGIHVDSAERRELTIVSYKGLRDSPHWQDSGSPLLAAISGNTLYIAPPGAGPDGVNIILQYFKRWEALSDSNPTNALLEFAYDVYLYAGISEGCGWLMNYAGRDYWLAHYKQAVQELHRADNMRRYRSGTFERYAINPRDSR